MHEYLPLFGAIIQTVLFLLGVYAMVLRNDTSNKSLSNKLEDMQNELRGLAKVITEQAVQHQRLNEQSRRMGMLEQRVEDLRRGKGYVNDRDAESVDREY